MNRMFFRFACAPLTGIMLGGFALAQNVTVPAPQPIPAPVQIEVPRSHAEAARDMLIAAHAVDPFRNMLPGLLRQMSQTLSGTNLTLQADPEKKAALEASVKQVEQDLGPEVEKLIADISLLYAARFSEAELKTLTTFFKSPEGQKFVTISPQIVQESFRMASGWSEEITQTAFEKLRAEMKKRNVPLQ